MRTFLVGSALFALSSLMACSAGSEDVGSSEANQTSEPRQLGVIKGRELARCWFALVGEDQELTCRTTARGADPLKLDVRVGLSGSSGILKSLDVDAGGTAVIGKFPVKSFGTDRSFELQAYLGQDARSMLEPDEGSWTASVDHVDPAAYTAEKPLVLTEPFDLWELGTVFSFSEGGGYSFTAHEYKIDLGAYRAGLVGNAAMTFKPDIFGTPGKISYIVAPKEVGPLAITWSHGAKKIETSIAGPGYYMFHDEGIRPATREEILAKYGGETTTNGSSSSGGNAAPDPKPEPQPEPQPDPQPEPTPSWVDPDPSCGGVGQRYCSANGAKSCDPSTRWDYSSQCVACGNVGQTYCLVEPNHFDSSKGKACNDGTRWDYASQCVPCGNAGQTYCLVEPNHFDSSLGKSCNDGTRWDYASQCVPCGNAGQTYCLVEPNHFDSSLGKACNAGTRWDYVSQCIPCGGENQTYCLVEPNHFDASQGKACNDGLELRGDGVCVK